MLLRLSTGALLPAFGLVLCLSGCAAVRSYDTELNSTLVQASGGNVDGAIRILESNNRLPDKDLLYYLELGMLQRLGSRYQESQKAWIAANQRIQIQEHSMLANASTLVRGTSSYLVNDKLRPYAGHDYEKVLLLTYIALNHLAKGEYENARVAIKQTHELEAVIAEQRSKEIAEVEEDAKKRGARTSFRELNGYPVETIENPEVNALRNSYQSALSHYLAGFIYESLGEPSLAAPGYRLANELQPGTALLEEALRGLDQRVAAPDDGKTDVLFLIASGTAPALQSRQFHMFVPVHDKVVLLPVAFPVMPATWSSRQPIGLAVDDGPPLAVAPITSIDLMARRQLKDDMPGIMLRATIRVAASAMLQYQAQRAGDKQHAAASEVAAIVVMAGSAVFASADDRTWRTLPSEISIARARVPAGVHTVTLHTAEGPRSMRVDLSGRYAVVDFRLLRNQLFVQSPSVEKTPTREGSR
jgi:hypothetical protein